MEKDERIVTETGEEESFAELLDKTYVEPGRLQPGEKVSARIIKIAAEWVFLDLGRKGEGCLSKKELVDEQGNLTAKEGDVVQAYFVSSSNNELLFTTKISAGAAGLALLEDAWRNGIPVDGRVDRAVKGGYEVRIAGSVRAFCPHSQMGLPRMRGQEEVVGKHLPFRITEFKEKGRNIIVSHRVILEETVRQEKEALRESLREGMTVKGTITSLRDFGAFVNIGPVEGLIPISEVGWSRVEDIRDALSVGQEVEVVITRLDWAKERYSFSLKQALANPWDSVEDRYPIGSVHTGKVVRLTAFGAFVALGPGVDGLVHISKLSGGKRINHPRDVVGEGQELEVKVESVDREKRRVSLAPVRASAPAEPAEESDDYRQYMNESPKPTGSFGELLKARIDQKGRP